MTQETITAPRKFRRLAIGSAAAAAIAAASLAGAGDAAAYPRGYVSDANLRAQPTTNSAVLARITNQYVDIICYTQGQNVNGTAKWFKAQYYSNVGFLSASVVSQQPSVGSC